MSLPTSPPPRTWLRLAALVWLLGLGLFVLPATRVDTVRGGGSDTASGTTHRPDRSAPTANQPGTLEHAPG